MRVIVAAMRHTFAHTLTALLLLGQFRILRSTAILVLACGYLFSACMTVAHALTFPGLLSPTGLLGESLIGSSTDSPDASTCSSALSLA